MAEESTIQLFNQPAVPLVGRKETMLAAAVARASAEVKAAMIMAKEDPRDPVRAWDRIQAACKRQSLAEVACYAYPRGGTTITGPSIRLAECLAQNWGNLDFGIIELDQRDGESSVMAYAWDLETNTRQTKVFTVKHERKAGGVIKRLDDPRDIYEMVANQGARRVRACILGVIPGDVIEAAVTTCENTLKHGASEPLIDRLRKMVGSFGELGVTQTMLEKRLGHKLDATNEHELVTLRKIFTSLRDGAATREDFFVFEPAKPQFTDTGEGSDVGPQVQQPEAPKGRPRRQPKAAEQPPAEPPPQPQQQDLAGASQPTPPPTQPPAPAPAPRTNGGSFNHLRALRGLAKLQRIEEADLLNAGRELDIVPDDIATLDELANNTPDRLVQLYDRFQTIADAIKASQKA